tara:strand:+ start:5702 stop:5998 length:297 start_codon:yes stop_codon:yes gene_type:complete
MQGENNMIIKKNVAWKDVLPKSCQEEMIRNVIDSSPCGCSREQALGDLEVDTYDLVYERDMKMHKSKLTWVGSRAGADSIIPNGNSELIRELMGWEEV